ncbi:GspE/PulE family protein [Gryllotalpicola reticulitermitis]|uniref:GspE/PulE family protein n=1 Tax=Gryllotalpicola reticulitermitis TaxID=1184153 RepID=A0ABV8Q4V0_9MICO
MASLTEILILHGALPIEQLDLMAAPSTEVAELERLVGSGTLTPGQLARARAARAGVNFLELADFPVDRQAVGLVNPTVLRRHHVLPIGFERDHLVVATDDPENLPALDDIRTASGRPLTLAVVERGDLEAAFNRYLRADGELSDLTATLEEEQAKEEHLAAFDTEIDVDDAPIVRFVNLIVSQAIQDDASDIHIEPGEHEVRVRYRIDGVLHEMQSAPKAIQNGVISRLKIMSDIDIAERRKPQDGRMSVSHAGRQIDLRVATLPTVWGEKVVMRILDNTATEMTLDSLALLPRNFEVYRRSYTKPYGMILVTGPTGSGKSTTLYTTLNTVSKPEINVITVEDPVEYRMPGINQVQVNPKAGLTFASALRSILRSDPDVVLLGEIRDHETAQIAIEAALTGHLVLSTLHTNDAPSAVTRLTEMNIEPFLVGSALDCVVAQRLARRLCERCKAPVAPDPERLENIGFSVAELDRPGAQLFAPVGCQACSHTGYRGRMALHEIMPVTEEIERLTVSRASSADIGRVAREQGMLTLREDGWAKCLAGWTSVDEVLRVVA